MSTRRFWKRGPGVGPGALREHLVALPVPTSDQNLREHLQRPGPLPRGFLLCASLPTQSPAQGGAAVSQPVCPCIRGAGARAGDSEAKAGALRTVMFRVSLLINTATLNCVLVATAQATGSFRAARSVNTRNNVKSTPGLQILQPQGRVAVLCPHLPAPPGPRQSLPPLT